MRIVGYAFATIGLAYAVKQIMNYKKGCCSCGWHKIKVEEEKPADETVPNDTKVEDKKRTGTRYGSNPVRY